MWTGTILPMEPWGTPHFTSYENEEFHKFESKIVC
jgi:hypothetical protein